MEITKLFKATVKAVKVHRKDIERPNILPKSKQKSEKTSFHQSAVDVVRDIIMVCCLDAKAISHRYVL